jgi:hypothetical protein
MGWPVNYHSAISEVYQYMTDRRKDEVKGRFRPALVHRSPFTSRLHHDHLIPLVLTSTTPIFSSAPVCYTSYPCRPRRHRLRRRARTGSTTRFPARRIGRGYRASALMRTPCPAHIAYATSAPSRARTRARLICASYGRACRARRAACPAGRHPARKRTGTDYPRSARRSLGGSTRTSWPAAATATRAPRSAGRSSARTRTRRKQVCAGRHARRRHVG